MAKKDEGSASGAALALGSCCKMESVVTIDERGQIVLPKDIRDRAGLQAGDKLALIVGENNRKVCCLFLISVDELKDAIKNTLGPLMKEILLNYEE